MITDLVYTYPYSGVIMASIDDSEHFGFFTKSVERAIAKYGHLKDEDMTALQKRQVDELAKLEVKFRKALVKDPNGESAYLAFIAYILEDKKNILAARPYFRERRAFFASDIANAIRTKDIKKLQKFHCNYHFVTLIVKGLVFGEEVNFLIKKIQDARQKLIILNLPLVINRARIFWSRTPRSHLSFIDMIQIGVEGLIAGIDKYCGEYSKVYRSVLIGRMVGSLIENYSSTMLHFYPGDKRKIYRANKFKSKHLHGDYETEDLVTEVSKAEGNETNSEEITGLMAASSVVSADTSTPNDSLSEPNICDNIARYEAPEETRPDLQVEAMEVNNKMRQAMSKLSLFDRKLLKLKGLDVSLE
jgi:RNA polymerase sigma factor (sigma-70 family)